MFKINDKIYEIEYAFLDALLDDDKDKRLIIGLVIAGKRIDDNTLPSIDTETLLKINSNEIKKWQDIGGRIIEWEKPSKVKFYNIGKK